MTKAIRVTGPTLGRIRDVSKTLPRIDAAEIAAALGAEACTERLAKGMGPVTLLAVRQELARRLHSSGGRPALAGTTRRVKIPLTDDEWVQLEKLAAAVTMPGTSPSAGQVASVLLSLALHSVATAGVGATEGPSGEKG